MALQLAGALCLGAMAVRLPSWWSTSDAWVASTSLGTQALLCRLSVAVAYGAALPQLTSPAPAPHEHYRTRLCAPFVRAPEHAPSFGALTPIVVWPSLFGTASPDARFCSLAARW